MRALLVVAVGASAALAVGLLGRVGPGVHRGRRDLLGRHPGDALGRA